MKVLRARGRQIKILRCGSNIMKDGVFLVLKMDSAIWNRTSWTVYRPGQTRFYWRRCIVEIIVGDEI
jgi:hypothetical protein